MKQPETWIEIAGGVGLVEIEVVNRFQWVGIGDGKTLKSALKAAHRRLERLTRDVVRELEGLENGD